MQRCLFHLVPRIRHVRSWHCLGHKGRRCMSFKRDGAKALSLPAFFRSQAAGSLRTCGLNPALHKESAMPRAFGTAAARRHGRRLNPKPLTAEASMITIWSQYHMTQTYLEMIVAGTYLGRHISLALIILC